MRKVRNPAMIVVAMISKMLCSNAVLMIVVSTVFCREKFSMALKDLLINFGVNKENIWAAIVVIIPNKKRYLYLMKYLFKYCNSFIYIQEKSDLDAAKR